MNKCFNLRTKFKSIATFVTRGMLFVCFAAVAMFGVAQLSEHNERGMADGEFQEGLAGGA